MNARVIPADIEINERILAKIIDEQFKLRPNRIVLLGEGFDNAVYLVNDRWVFRLPRRSEAIELIATEIHILPRLQDRLTLAVPRPKFIGVPSPHFPRPFYGHELIAGQPGSKIIFTRQDFKKIAEDLATFLRGLHTLKLNELGLSPADFPPYFDRSDFGKLKAVLDLRLSQIQSAYQLEKMQPQFDAVAAAAKRYVGRKDNTVLIHGDLYHRHLIFDENKRLTGAIDWGDCAIGDPVADLGVVYQFLPSEIRPRFFAHYGHVDDDTQAYARFIGLYYAVALLWFGHDRNDQDLIRTSLWTFGEL